MESAPKTPDSLKAPKRRKVEKGDPKTPKVKKPRKNDERIFKIEQGRFIVDFD